MFQRATLSLVATAAACAAAALIVFALGFALFALVEPTFGAAGAAASVAGVAALGIAFFAYMMARNAQRQKAESEHVTAQLSQILPQHIGAFAAERPLVGLAATLAAGFIAARHPGLVRDLISALSSSQERR
jgi:membrane protein implicated in regulation of membrane protease activity